MPSSETMSHDGALVGGAAGLLGNGGKATGAQNVDGAVHVAVGLDEGLLALHHAGAGHFAEFLDHGSGDVCHRLRFLSPAELRAASRETGPASLVRGTGPDRLRKGWSESDSRLFDVIGGGLTLLSSNFGGSLGSGASASAAISRLRSTAMSAPYAGDDGVGNEGRRAG